MNRRYFRNRGQARKPETYFSKKAREAQERLDNGYWDFLFKPK